MQVKTMFFEEIDRYVFDFGFCSGKKGFAQVDTEQDAWYHGIWANPKTRTIISYAEGDVTRQVAETDVEFVRAIEGLKGVYQSVTIDAGFDTVLKQQFVSMGLGQMLG